MEECSDFSFFEDFFDDGAWTAMSPMCVTKPSAETLERCKPGKLATQFSQTFKHEERREGDCVYPVLVDEVMRKTLAAEYIPAEIVNRNTAQMYTPNLFFRFCCRLFGVYCPLNTNGRELYFYVFAVLSFLSLFCRRSPSMVLPSATTGFSSFSTRRSCRTTPCCLLLALHCGVCWTW